MATSCKAAVRIYMSTRVKEERLAPVMRYTELAIRPEAPLGELLVDREALYINPVMVVLRGVL